MIFLLKIAALLILAVPMSFILTIASFPFWRWIDVTTRLEAFGHSGPAEWCFYLVYAILLTVGFSAWRISRARSGNE